jgi:glycosyltransferase involved in cell wall biosynthesis
VLTIAIPTFDRGHLLRASLERLLPQMDSNQRLLIVDNCSREPVEQTLGGWLRDSGARNVRIVRNPVNIGGAANILRCLELCETRWLYCLGDDDLVASDCISAIEATIAMHPEALYYSFSRDIRRRAGVVRTQGMAQLIEHLDDWSSFLFMSSTVVNAERLRSGIRWGYLYAYSWAPLQAILFKLLERDEAVVFSDRILCHEESLSDDTWVPFAVAAGKMVLPELLTDPSLRRALAARLMAYPRPSALIYWARVKSDATSIERNRLFVNLYIGRGANYGQRVKLTLYRLLASVMLRPRVFPDWLFDLLQSLVFKAMRRAIPNARPMSHDRT